MLVSSYIEFLCTPSIQSYVMLFALVGLHTWYLIIFSASFHVTPLSGIPMHNFEEGIGLVSLQPNRLAL